MKKIAHFIVQYPRAIVALALVLAVFAGIQTIRTPMNYDIFSYLPDDVESVKGQLIMTEEFNAADTAFAMIEGDKIAHVRKVKADLEAIDGVDHVEWITDMVDPSIPHSFIPEEILSLYKKGGKSLLYIFFSDQAASDQTIEATGEIETYLKGAPFTGMPAFVYELKQLVESQRNKSVIAAVVLSALVTAIATGSFIIPILILSSIGVGIVYNMGTNSLLGGISYITGAVAAVIQLGVTFDFSIFLLHRYREELHCLDDEVQAMENAIHLTFSSIMPSALTTMAGFLALSLMRVRIGLDMGVVMSKGVFIGFLTTLIVLPALVLVLKKRINLRAMHESKARYDRFSGWLVDHSMVLSIIFVLVFIPAIYGKYHTGLSYDIQKMLPQGLHAIESIEQIESTMGSVEMIDILFDENTAASRRKAALDQVEGLPGVIRVISMTKVVDPSIPKTFIPGFLTDRFVHGGWMHAVVRISVKPGTDEGNQLVTSIRDIIRDSGIEGYCVAGLTPMSKDLFDISQADIIHVNMASLIAILAIVTIVFMSVSIPVILVAAIQLAIFINLAIPFYMSSTIPYITFTSISAIQLGSTVDYAILLMSRYKHERQGLNPRDAMIKALSGSIPAILIAGFSLFAATIGVVFISDVDTLKSLSLMIARGALISMTVIICLLPSIIVVSDRIIRATSLGWKKYSI
ncbi:MAG: MMPL family transporter [Thermodesulfobacteriota bacterium]|nr:MMPL family transporter [Thermodesulfobacteriota bacterium]